MSSVSPNGFNLVGHLDSVLGMGQAARNLVAALELGGVPYKAINVRFTEADIHEPLETADDPEFSNTIWAVNPERLVQAKRHLPKVVEATTRSIGYWWWELNELPPVFKDMQRQVDEIWAPSSFIAKVFNSELSRPVFKVPLVVPEIQQPKPETGVLLRGRLSLDSDSFVVLTTLDLLSSLDRKNVRAAVEAFSLACAQDGKSRLIIKVLNGDKRTMTLQALKELVASNRQISIMDEVLPRNEMLALISESACLLALHRSEGLGLHLLEAMALGTPVMTSNFSGNLDFCDDTNSILINGTLVAAHDSSGQYLSLPRATWFEPNTSEAVAALRQLRDNQELRAQLSRNGKATYERFRDAKRFSNFAKSHVAPIAKPQVKAPELNSNDSLAKPGFGVNLSGYLEAEFGMGEYARRLLSSLQSAGVPVRCELLRSRGIRSTEALPSQTLTAYQDCLPFPINLVVVNADDFPQWARNEGSSLIRDRYTIGIWAWELETFPQHLHDAFNFVDEVWGISKFSAAAIEEFSPVPVCAIPPLVNDFDTKAKGFDRSELGISQTDFVATYVFDYYGTLKRKNPEGAIEAFKRAFSPNEGAVLVLKSINENVNPRGRAKLLELAQGREDIKFIEGYWSRDKIRSLVADSDVYLSLHRSEGLGFGMAEALSDGVPVIATNYGGHLDFANSANSTLIAYELTTVGEGASPYPPTALWAEPDIASAAHKLREFFEESRSQNARGDRQSMIPVATGSNARNFLRNRLKEINDALAEYTPQPVTVAPTEGASVPEGDNQHPVWWQTSPTAWLGFNSLVSHLTKVTGVLSIDFTNLPFTRFAEIEIQLKDMKASFKLRHANEKVNVRIPLSGVDVTDETKITIQGEGWSPDNDPRTLYLLIGPTVIEASTNPLLKPIINPVKLETNWRRRVRRLIRP